MGINFRPFVNKLIWVSVKTSSERFFIKFPLLFVRELFDTFLRSLRFFVFICFFVSLYFPFFALSLWVVLSHDSVKTCVLLATFLLLTAAFNVDSSVGTFSESIPRKAVWLLTLISADSGWFCNLLVLERASLRSALLDSFAFLLTKPSLLFFKAAVVKSS